MVEMDRRQFGRWLLAAAAGLGVLECVSDRPSREPKLNLDDVLQTTQDKLSEKTNEEILAREIRKWDQWVLEFLDAKNDPYSTKVSFSLKNKNVTKELMERAFSGLVGQQGDGKIWIAHYTSYKGEKIPDFPQLDHELVHETILDWERGIMRLPDYEGPSYDKFREKIRRDLYAPEKQKKIQEGLKSDWGRILDSRYPYSEKTIDEGLKEMFEGSLDPNEPYFKDKLRYTEEVLARVMSEFLKADPTQHWCDDEYVIMLKEMRYKGKPVFGKASEKYDLARDIYGSREHFASPIWEIGDEISHRLIYATSAKYKGKEYSWPSNNFRFEATIPVSEFEPIPTLRQR